MVYFGIYAVFLFFYIIKGIIVLKNDFSSNIIYNKPKNINNVKQSIIILNNLDNQIKVKTNKINNIQSKNNILNRNKNNKRLLLRKDLKRNKANTKIIFDFPPKKILFNQNNIEIYNKELSNNDKQNKFNLKNLIFDINLKPESKGLNHFKSISKEILLTINE